MIIRPLSLFLGYRYTRAKRRNRFISFISLASILGLALGVMVLITALSVMNGFDFQIRRQFFTIAPDVTVMASRASETTLSKWQRTIAGWSEVAGVAPFVSAQGLLMNGRNVSGVTVLGIDPAAENTVSVLNKKMVSGDLSTLTPDSFHVVMGQQLASRLGAYVFGPVNLFMPQTLVTPIGVFPRYKRLTMSGIFATKSGFGYDDGLAYVNRQDALKLFPSGGRTAGLHLRLHSIDDATEVTERLQQQLPDGFVVSNWMMQYGAFFKALAMEKVILFVVLLFIIAVAVFNLVSTLVMAVQDKRADIAILRTLGLRPRTVMCAFVWQGGIIGLWGSLLGMLLGVVLSWYITDWTNAIQSFFHVKWLNSSVYFVDYLPSRLSWMDVLRVGSSAMGLSLLATLYPAYLAYRTEPAEALRYE